MVKRAEQPGRRAVKPGSGGGGNGSEPLPEAAGELLQKIFAVQSELPPALAESVAARTGCTPAAALAFFVELHASFKRCLRRLEDSAADAGRARARAPLDEEAALAAAAAGAAAREAALAKLRPLLDGGTGGLRDASVTGQFASVMAGLSSNVVRVEAAQAVAASKRTVRAKLVASSGFLATLEGWLEEAREQEFYTLQRQLLCTLDALPLGAALLRGSDKLLGTVRRLQGGTHPDVAAVAESLSAKWQEVLAAGGEAAPLPASMGAAAAALPSWAAGAAPGSEPGAARGYRSLPSAGVQPRAEGMLSANGVRRQQERLHQAAHQAPGQKDAGLHAQHAQQGQHTQQDQHAHREVRPEQQQQQPPSQQQQHSGAATTASRRSLQSSSLFQKIRRSLAAAKSAAGLSLGSASGAGRTSMAGASLGATAGTPRSQLDTPRVQAAAAGAAALAPSATQASDVGPESVRSLQQAQAAAGRGGEQEAASAAPARSAPQREQAPPPPPPPPPPSVAADAAARATAVRAAPAEARVASAGSPRAALPPAGSRPAPPAPPAGQAGTRQQPASGAVGPAESRAPPMTVGAAAHGAPPLPGSAAQRPPAPQLHARPVQQAAPAASPAVCTQAVPHPAAAAGVPAATGPGAPLYAAAPGRAAAARLPPAAAASQQQHQQWQNRGPGSKRQRSHRAGASAPAAPAAAAGRTAKRARHLDVMREQTAWRVPPACAAAPAGLAAHGRAAVAPACGEESLEAPALAAMRRAGRLPLCDDGGAAQERVPAMPWWPLVPSEVQEQRARLEAAGWRGWAT